jgi:hypothetical protein
MPDGYVCALAGDAIGGIVIAMSVKPNGVRHRLIMETSFGPAPQNNVSTRVTDQD